MKNIFIIISLVFLLFSCGESDKPGLIEETGDIVGGYVDTLEGSIKDAHKVTDIMNSRVEDLKKDIK